MAYIVYSLSAKSDRTTKQHEVLIRFASGHRFNMRAKTNVFVEAKHWNSESQSIIVPKRPRWRILTDENRKQLAAIEVLQRKSDRLKALSEFIFSTYQNEGGGKQLMPKDWLKNIIIKYNGIKVSTDGNVNEPQQSFFDTFEYYIDNHKFSEHRRRQCRVVKRAFKRFELYKGLNLTFDDVTPDTLRSFEDFLSKEHTLIERAKYRKIMEVVPESRTPQPRGKNTINDFMTKLRSFFIWVNDSEITTNNPFKHYRVNECVYGTPYYITIEERNAIYNVDLSDNPKLAIQRDIFVFQCLIGCRVSDLWAMTKDNLINGAIEYIPRKTKEGRPINVRVPLNATAAEIIARYEDYHGEKLFPFTSQQQYNIDIKKIFRAAGIDRIVTIINPTTGEEEKRPICDIASSHLARRTFVGNLYKKVKDPNLIGKLSGHKEGSRAFARYREIDEEMSKELVTMLE